MKKAMLIDAGSYFPERKLTNEDLAEMVETNDEWITSRTGIKERRIAGDDMQASDMAAEAARDCLSGNDIKPDLLISSSATAEKRCPYQASIVANKLGLKNIAAFDINAACSGLIYALTIAKSMIETGNFKNALVTASEKMSAYTDYKDRSSCILFGDGASSLLLSSEKEGHAILTTELGLDASGSDLVNMGGLGADYFFKQNGNNVFRFAVNKMSELFEMLSQRIKMSKKDKFYIVPHQANYRIIEAVAKNHNIPLKNFITNIERFGNTSSASIGLALKEVWNTGKLMKDDILFLIGFGGGLSWGGAAIQW